MKIYVIKYYFQYNKELDFIKLEENFKNYNKN